MTVRTCMVSRMTYQVKNDKITYIFDTINTSLN